jgi:hypothetical protein
MVFSYRVLRSLFDPKRDELTVGIMHNEELHNLCSSADIWRMRWAGHVVHMGDRKCIQNFGWKV